MAASKRRSPAKRRAPARASEEIETVSWWDDFYAVVRRIPRGRVTTYGAVALFAGYPRAARHVGWAMAALKDVHGDVPWQRVLAAASRTRAKVTIKDPVGGALQRAILEGEGVLFDALGRVDLTRFGWSGPRRARPATTPKRRASRAKPAARGSKRSAKKR